MPSRTNALKSFEKADKWIRDAKKNFHSKSYDSCVIASYLAMFHSARALLIRDGFREKSHVCIARYLEERYVKTKKLEAKWVNLLDRFRDLRHEDQYDISFFATERDAQNSLSFVERFMKRMRRLL